MRVGYTGDRIRHARTRRNHRDTKLAGEFGMCLCHVNGGTLVANVDDPNSLRIETHPDRHDVAAAESENASDPTSLQKAGDQVGSAIRQDFHLKTPIVSKR
jgi:hypothetical protein